MRRFVNLRLLLILLACALMVGHCLWFRDFWVDDAAISFSYARSLAQGHGLVSFAGGERVEGYSNFLWVVLMAAGVRAGFEVFFWSHLVAIVLAVATVLGAAELLATLRGRRTVFDAAPAWFVATLTPVAYFGMSGLENPLMLALLVWLPVFLQRELSAPPRLPISALLAAALALTRPEGVLYVVAAGVARVLSGPRLRRDARWLGVALVPILLHLGWRYSYYAYPQPNTYYAKLPKPFDFKTLVDFKSPGWSYVIGNLTRYDFRWCLVPIGLTLLRWRGLAARLSVVLLLFGVLFFCVFSQGDWMSEGRFLVPAIPLAAVLWADGILSLGSLIGRWAPAWAPPLLTVALMTALSWAPAKKSVELSKFRRGHYPVPVQAVAVRARAYAQAAQHFQIARPSALDGDLGATSYYANMPIYDMGSLCDVTFARWWSRNPAMLREYIYGERRGPAIMRQLGFWLDHGLTYVPDFSDRYVPWPRPLAPEDGLYLDGDLFRVEGIDTRQPLTRLGAAGVEALGASVGRGAGEGIDVWLLVRAEPPMVPLVLQLGSQRVPLQVGDGILPRERWRAGEVLRAHYDGTAGGPVSLSAGESSFALAPGRSGSLPLVLPVAQLEVGERALAHGELELALAVGRSAGNEPLRDRAARALLQRGVDLQAQGEADPAFAAFRTALAAMPSLSWARRHLEELRLTPRRGYHYRWQQRLRASWRDLHLQPDILHLSAVIVAAAAAERPDSAVAAHLAVGQDPTEPATRLALAEAYYQVGLPERGVKFLPSAPPDLAAAERVQRIALAAGRADLATAAQRLLAGDHGVPVAAGLRLTAAWAQLTSSGLIELALAFARTAPGPEKLLIAGKSVAFTVPPHDWLPGEIYVQHRHVDLPAGSSRIAVGDHALTVQVTPFATDFENGRMDGWQRDDAAFASVAPAPGAGLWGYRGSWLLDSRQGGVTAQGSLRSPPLAADLDEVCYLSGAGTAAGTTIGIEIAGTVAQVAPQLGNTKVLSESCLNLRALTGERRLLLEDHTSSVAGFLLFDDLECIRAGTPVPCGGAVQISVAP